MMFSRRAGFCVSVAVLLLAGCGGGRDVGREELEAMAGGELKETVPVSGKVTIDGQPTSKVFIYAFTQAGGMEPVYTAETNDDGTYCWATYSKCDGIVPGEYKLAFAHIPKEGKGNDMGQDMLNGKYMNPMQSGFDLKVELGAPQENVDYELTTGSE